MAFLIGFTQIVEDELSSIYDGFKAEFDKLVTGSLSLPINLPGTSYYRGFKVCSMLNQVMLCKYLRIFLVTSVCCVECAGQGECSQDIETID